MTWVPAGGDPLALRQRADQARLSVVNLPPGSDERRELEVWIDLDELIASVSGGQWTPQDEARLTRLEQAVAAPPAGLGKDALLGVRLEIVMMRAMRLLFGAGR